LLVVAHGKFDGVAHVAKFARSARRIDAARDFAVMNVEAGNDTFGQHRAKLNRRIAHEANAIHGVVRLND
jgi:hypothetical protein